MSKRPSNFAFKKGDCVKDLDGRWGVVLGMHEDAEDCYTHWIVRWDIPVTCVSASGKADKEVYLITSIRECELS